MMVNWKFAWREVRQRPSRAILTLLSIVIGVAAVVAVTIASGTTNKAFDNIFKTVAGNAQFEVAAPLGSAIDEKIVDRVREVSNVKAVAPLIKRDTVLYIDKNKHYRLVVLGVDPQSDAEVRDYMITEGKSLEEAPGILLEYNFAKNAGVKIGQAVEMLTRRGLWKGEVVGLYKSEGAAASAQGLTMLIPLPAAQSFFRSFKKIDSAQIVLKPGVNEEQAKAEIQKHLPEGIKVRKPESRSALADETSLSTQMGMRLARAFSLVVAAFIIMNALLINVTQRRKQLGIMRAIGGTRRQIAGMVVREALLMGLVGTILGSGLGVVVAHYLTRAMGSLYQTSLPKIELSYWPFLIGAACGIGVSLISAVFPAWKAAKLSPLEAMRDVRAEELEGSSYWLVWIGAFVALVGLGIMLASIRGYLPPLHAVWAAVLLLTGTVLMLPIALSPFSYVAVFLMARVIPVESKLARLQLLRHLSRTTLTIVVVFFAISTGIGLASSIMDTVENVRTWYRKAIVADFVVRAGSPSMATGAASNIPDNVPPEIKKISGIKSIDAINYRRVDVGEEQATIIARDHSAPEAPDLDVVTGDLDELRQQFVKGEVAVGSVLAERLKLNIGDRITLEPEGGPKSFHIAAIVNDYQLGGLVIHMEREIAHDQLGIEGMDGLIIKVDRNRSAEIHNELEEIAKKSGLVVQSFIDIRAQIDVMMAGVVAALWGLVVVMLVVSAVGVTNTLTINVLEQTREIGLLRIVAMTQRQVRRSIFSQALIVALLALVPGIIAGVAIAYLMNLAMLSVTGHVVDFTLHPGLMAGGLLLGIFIVSMAAWFPANRASRLDLPTALRTT
jgi:putative ABC transport system permease protein